MSSLKTEQYQLHQWEPGDSVLREEFNENFAKLDVSTRLFFGSYTGDGAAERLISLPITPKAVLLFTQEGNTGQDSSSHPIYGGLALPDQPIMLSNLWGLRIVEGGFEVQDNFSRQVCCNYEGKTYHYLAFY